MTKKTRMKNRFFLTILVLLTVVMFQSVSILIATATNQPEISGSLQHGYRVLTFTGSAEDVKFIVYRGDYIKFDLNGKAEAALLEIPSLAISKELTFELDAAPYFKMKKVGKYPFSLGGVDGIIEVVEYDQPHYQTVSANDAALLIDNISPLILDVRTPREYAGGHLKNSVIIPVQELQQRHTELAKYRDENILLYCATGNRSTVAAKILIDNGFTRIYNLRYGIVDWTKRGKPIVR